LTEYETEFSEFPKDCEVKRLNELAKIIMGQSPPSSAYNDKGQGLPFIQGSKDFGDIYPSIKTFTTICKKIAPKDSILFSVRAPVGDINISDREICIGRGIAAIVPYNKTDLLYLYYYLTYSAFKIKRYSSGTTFESIKERDLENFQITLPPLDERKKIVKILNAVDFIITDTTNLIEKLRVIKEKALHLLITGSIWHKEFVKTDIGEFPKDWEVKRLSEIAKIESGKREKGGGKETGEVISLGGEHISPDGKIILNSPKYISKKFYDSLKSGKVKEKDIILVKDGATTGKAAFLEKFPAKEVAVNEHLFIIRSKTSNIDQKFLYYIIISNIFQNQIKSLFHGIIGGITKSEIEVVYIPIPPLEEQKKIVEILTTIDNKIETETKYLDYMKKLKEKLLAALMTGKIRVNSIAIGDLK